MGDPYWKSKSRSKPHFLTLILGRVIRKSFSGSGPPFRRDMGKNVWVSRHWMGDPLWERSQRRNPNYRSRIINRIRTSYMLTQWRNHYKLKKKNLSFHNFLFTVLFQKRHFDSAQRPEQKSFGIHPSLPVT